MHVFLSPHYDDVVYSCGATVHRLVQAGERVMVYTVMAAEPPHPLPDTPIIQEVHARWQAGANPVIARLAEDKAALAVLGAQGQYHTWPDCIYRTHDGLALYPTGAAIFGPIHPQDPARTLGLHLPPETTHVYAPLGIGQHVDHRLVRDWALQQIQAGLACEWWFYADYPYAEKPAAIQPALDALSIPLTPTPMPIEADNLQAKIHSAARYATQLSTFWRDETHLHQAMQAFAQYENGYQERFWRLG